MKKIIDYKIIGSEKFMKFEELLSKTIDEYQDKKYKVEIQFQTNNTQLVALVIARK